MLPRVPRVLVRANVVPRPTVKSPLLDPRYVIGHKVVTEAVALVYRAPQFARLRVDRDADGVADAGGVNAASGSVRVEFQNGRPILFVFVRVFIDVRVRADRDEHLFTVGSKNDIAG